MTTNVRTRIAVGAPAIAGLALVGATLTPATAAAETATAGGPASAPVPTYTIVERGTLRPEPALLPVAGYQLTGRFADQSGLWSSGSHTGLDFAASYGAAIRAVTAGTVVSSGYDGAYGYKTVLRLEDRTELWFCHQASVAVDAGARVAAGDVIGAVGTSGNVTGPHLHLEVHPGGDEAAVDPYAWLVERGLQP